jgi:cyanophycinase
MAVIALLGSGEFEPWARPVDTWCAEHATSTSDRALVIPTAAAPEGDAVFDRWGSQGVAHYGAIGLAPVVLQLKTREDASKPDIVDAVSEARLLFFSGGNPGYLCETIADTPFWHAVCAAVAAGVALGGCSAGAVAVGTLAPFVANDQLDHWVPGLKLLENAFVMPHFDQLDNYQPGMRAGFLAMRPEGQIALGLDEHTALYGDDGDWQVAGAQGVWIGEGAPDDLVELRDGQRSSVRLGLRLP